MSSSRSPCSPRSTTRCVRPGTTRRTTSPLPASCGPGGCDLAIMTGHVAQVFTDKDSWRRTLREVHRALAPGGRVAFEFRRPEVRVWTSWNPNESRARHPPECGPGHRPGRDHRRRRRPGHVLLDLRVRQPRRPGQPRADLLGTTLLSRPRCMACRHRPRRSTSDSTVPTGTTARWPTSRSAVRPGLAPASERSAGCPAPTAGPVWWPPCSVPAGGSFCGRGDGDDLTYVDLGEHRIEHGRTQEGPRHCRDHRRPDAAPDDADRHGGARLRTVGLPGDQCVPHPDHPGEFGLRDRSARLVGT